jgi:hypothetical protein
MVGDKKEGKELEKVLVIPSVKSAWNGSIAGESSDDSLKILP